MRKLIALGLLLLSTNATAGLIHSYDFTLNGTSGSFSYMTPGPEGRYLGVPFETFDFTWLGIDYSASDVLWGALWVLEDGQINLNFNTSFFGNDCIAGMCGVFSGANEWLFQFASPDAPNHRNFSWGFAGNTNGSQATTYTITYAGSTDPDVVTTSVPEPASLIILGLGLLVLLRKRANYDM